MTKGRLEAFTDGVIAVIITIMVLELKAPAEATWDGLAEELPVFASYVMSFVYVGIYWNNHHHMLHLAERINGKVMWANLTFLFCLSLFPFATHWLNSSHPIPSMVPTAFYGIVMLMTASSWIPLARSLVGANGGASGALGRALGKNWKGRVSVVIYALAIALVFVTPILSCVLYAVVAVMWFVPDRRIEANLVRDS